jgi:hypothetical protein
MPIINVEPGEVYEFTTIGGSSNIISQFAGTSEVFTKDVYGITRYTGSSAQLLLESDARIDFKNCPILYIRASKFSLPTIVATDSTPKTSSYETLDDILVTGSLIRSRGANDHLIKFGSTPILGSSRPEVEIIRGDDNTSKITISGSSLPFPSGTGPYYFNGTEALSGSFSCTDPFCSIKIYASGFYWVVTNAIGNWTSP